MPEPTANSQTLTRANMNQNIAQMEFEDLREMFIRAAEISEELREVCLLKHYGKTREIVLFELDICRSTANGGALTIFSISLQGAQKPFEDIILIIQGDCHSMGQRYVTFLRDVSALLLVRSF